MTPNADIPDDIREALKIREDLDGISGELLGYKKAATWLFVLQSFMVACVLFFWAEADEALYALM